MEREEATLRALLDYLLAHGYPEASLAVEYPIGGRYRADVAVVDPDSRLPVAIFELKRYENPQSRSLGQAQLSRLLHTLGTESVQAYLVWTTDEAPFFRIERVKSSPDREVLDSEARIEDVPFEIQRESVRSGRIEEKRKKERRWRWGLVASSVLVGCILFAFLGMELAGVVELRTPALLLLGAACIAILIPFFERIKFYGVELQKSLGKTRDASDD